MFPENVCINLDGTPTKPSHVRNMNNERHYTWKFTDPRNVDISGGFDPKREPRFHNGSSIVSIDEVKLILPENDPENAKILVHHDNEATVWTNKKLEDNIKELFDKKFVSNICFMDFHYQHKGKTVFNCAVKPVTAVAIIAASPPSSPVRKRKRGLSNIKNLITKSEHFTRLVEDIQKIIEEDVFQRIEKKEEVEV